ncbi:hypothetical protein RN001_012657 [Aquatica leii]|uniref:ABC transporter domain-containing protein n=1 Tax=Aquatica leii TaxID=1421715 RepID=A0AAN7NYQ4_9COLE|nr:hypothetical protein RN001_012657 [Aquatica leii]
MALVRLQEMHTIALKSKIDSNVVALFKAYCDRIENVYENFCDNHNQVIGLIPDDDTAFEEQDTVRAQADKIYGLLGASGCGKTTLLNCILNFRNIDSGKILVFGSVPGTAESGIPGPRVGYMPQELALSPVLSLREILMFYGWIAGLQTEEITERTNVLAKLLALPDLCNRINNLSGGQQRRVSLACALIHQPDLLILDEPTVGLESILRKDIWDYLQQLSKKLITIVITTHYIEETRQADIVGFMRGGSILAEDSPNNILTRFNEQTLEKVFLKLSVMQNSNCQHEHVNKPSPNMAIGLDDVDAYSTEITKNAQFLKERGEKVNRVIDSKRLKRIRFKAQLWKHLIWVRQHYKTILFFIFLNFFQTSFFCLTIGHNPSRVLVAAYNGETSNCKENVAHMECNSTKLGCIFLTYLENSIYKIYHSSEKSAMQSVLQGKAYASIVIKQNYSMSLRDRVKKWIFASSYDLEQSEISVINDNTNAEVSEYVILYLYKNFQNFLQDYLKSCKLNKRFMTYPVRIEDAVYGNNEPNFMEYFLPGFIISILTEKKIGDLERNQVVGVKLSEIVASYCLIELVLLVILIIITLVTIFYLFHATLVGSLEVAFWICFVAGLCGMTYGIFVGSICKTEFTAVFFSVSSLFPLVILSGIIWPLEGMHIIMQWIAHVFPVYTATDALRNIVHKGWGWREPGVYKGFIILSIWILVLLLLSSIFLKFMKIK